MSYSVSAVAMIAIKLSDEQIRQMQKNYPEQKIIDLDIAEKDEDDLDLDDEYDEECDEKSILMLMGSNGDPELFKDHAEMKKFLSTTDENLESHCIGGYDNGESWNRSGFNDCEEDKG